MKRLAVIFMLIFMFFPCAVLAQEMGFGLGLMLGDPTAISFKKWVGSKTAFDGGVGWSFRNGGSFHVHADYLIHSFNLITVKRGKAALCFGLGARLNTEDETKFGFRIPFGVSYIFEKAPLDIFFELAPLFDLVPSTEFGGLEWSIGVRYYF
ncbi:MAG: hypothetical protein GTN73_02615 [Candidatus Aminicenantes bacterium]|nr:hypothetical protein [Candidatus Aminicenantes bacterium]